jgi:4-hydroxymandelate oxidase
LEHKLTGFPEKMTARQEALARIPADIAAASDYEWLAARFMAPATLAWVAGGSGEELTLRGNRDAYAAVALRNRLWDLPAVLDTRLQLPGLDLAHPLLLAPVASQVLVHPQGEIATAQGAQAVAAGMVVSALASRPLQDICSLR